MDEAGGAFFVGAWLTIFGGLFEMVALVGLYDALRSAGPLLILASILAVLGLTLVTISHLIPIAIAYEIVLAYVDAEAPRPSLAVTTETLGNLALIVNYTGNVLNWASSCLCTWSPSPDIGAPEVDRLTGFVAAFFAGWLGP